MRVWLIRHGLTALGEAGKYQGRLDDGLSERGRAQLRSAAWTPSRVWVSPARRARETAAILFPESEQIMVPNLREMDFGAFEGRSWREMENDAAAELRRDYELPGGEPVRQRREVITGHKLLHVAHGARPEVRLIPAQRPPDIGLFSRVQRSRHKNHRFNTCPVTSASSIQSSAVCKNQPARSPDRPPNAFSHSLR